MKTKKKILVTSALPYANGPIHLGHLVEYIQTDIWVRFNKSIDNTVAYICADDAHGTPIMLKAQELKISPEDLISKMKEEHKKGLVNGPTVLNMMRNKRTQPLKFGQAVIFNPFIIHGNVAFVSNLARIAVSIRFQSIGYPIHQKNTDYFKSFFL